MNKLYVFALALAVLASPVVLGARVGTNGRMLLQANGSDGNSTGNSTYTLDTIVALVDYFNLTSSLSNVTVFAPTDDAFAPLLAALNVSSPADLTPEQQETVMTVLGVHVIPGLYASADVPMGETSVPNLAGTNTTVTYNSTGVYVSAGTNTAMVIDVDQTYGNATDVIVHVIDAVLIPAANTTM